MIFSYEICFRWYNFCILAKTTVFGRFGGALAITQISIELHPRNVHSMAAADLAFRLLGTSIGEPCSVDGSETCGESSFALYNYTRLVHILKVRCDFVLGSIP